MGGGGEQRGQQFGCMFAGLSEPLPICVVFISSCISVRGRGLLQKVIMRQRMGTDGAGRPFGNALRFSQSICPETNRCGHLR